MGWFDLVETVFPEHADVTEHVHDHAYVSFLVQGSYSERGAFRSYKCSAGAVIFHPAGDVHSNQFDRFGGRLLNLQLDPAWLARLADETGTAAGAAVPLRPSCFRIGLDLHAGFDSLPAEGVDEVAIELIAALAGERHLPIPPRWFKDSLGIIETCVHKGEPVRLRETARVCGVHPVHMSRCFRKFVGATFSRYVAQQRVRNAFQDLLETDMAIVDVAFHCGFADHAHFCRVFRSAVGLTPTQFRSRFART